MVEVILTDEATVWYNDLDLPSQEAVTKAVDRLVALGVKLAFPHSSEIKQSKYAMRELRVGGRPLRLLYIFDVTREAVVLFDGDKSGNERRWYDENVPRAERIWETYLHERGR